MSTFLYECQEKHGEFEREHSVHIKLEFCPLCEEDGNANVPIKRLINCSSKGKVELYGQDLVDKSKADTAAYKREVYANENTYANVIGPDKYQQIQTRMDKQKR
jgi:hypothetical protein